MAVLEDILAEVVEEVVAPIMQVAEVQAEPGAVAK